MFLSRITLLVFSFLLFACEAKSQTRQDSLDLWRDMRAFHRVNQKLDYDSILNFMPPRFFAIAPKGLMKSALQNTFENENFRMGFDTMNYKSVLPLVKIGNQICTMVHYDTGISITFSEEQDSIFINMMTETFSAQYGAENVRVNPENRSKLEIRALDKKMFAFKEPEWDSWKFLEDKRGEGDDARQQKILDMVIPKEVLEYFK
jgi:hypothetical protein